MFSIQIIVDKLVKLYQKTIMLSLYSYLGVPLTCVLTHDIFESQITNFDFAILMQKLLL